MNKEELEKMFDERFGISESYERIKDNVLIDDLKEFIFKTIIPEVLNNLLNEVNGERSNSFTRSKISGNYIIKDIKQRAKELYGIDL